MSAAMMPGWIIATLAALLATGAAAQSSSPREFVGFDRNDYPGDANLAALHKNFRFTSYWLNNPPGTRENSWTGKRALLKKNGFGFLVLFNGRLSAELRGEDAVALGRADGQAAVAAALVEGFPKNTLIFLDQEEGGRLLSQQADYLFAWADAVRAGGARAGVYCSGIEVTDSSGAISTARDIIEKENARLSTSPFVKDPPRLELWIANDQCPPSPGCSLRHPSMNSALPLGIAVSALVWQYAQSPRRTQFTGGCPANYSVDNRCYAPDMPKGPSTFVDLNVSSSPDPSSAQ